ncbi:hypothetical protein G9A89_011650 [Geosiphon pyriformis]|nr:hypothetical protein G9A89_011650 [Geosiphon pyriformis]
MEITDNIHLLAQQLFQLIQHQKMEITINQQTIQYQDTRKTLQPRTQKKTENTHCEEKYPVQSKYFFDFESETKTSNKGKQRLKQYSRTTSNTPTLQKTTAKHLQTPEQGTSVKLPLSITPFPISLVQPQTPSSPLSHFSRPEDFQSPKNPTQQQKPISTSANIIDYLQENKSNHSESLESKETESKPEEITENEEEMATAYIAKIPEFTGEDNDTSPQEWLDKVQKAGDANAFKDAFLQQFTDNNTSITLRNCFCNIKQETSESFIARLKDKLIKKVRPHAPTDLATAIRHAKSYEMAMKEANHTKLVNLAIGETSSAAEEKIDQLAKKDTGNEIVGNCKETNKTEVINITLHHNNPITNFHHQPIIHQDHKIKTTIHQLHNQCSNNISNLYQFSHIRHYPLNNIKYQQEDWFNITNSHTKINCRITTTESIQIASQQRPNHYHTQPSYLTIPEKSDFQQTALSEDEVTVLRLNPLLPEVFGLFS